jgi:hypothetical protein
MVPGHGESRLECGGLPPLRARPLGGVLRPEATFRTECGSELPHPYPGIDVTLTRDMLRRHPYA